MELYVKKNEPVHALQIKFPKANEGRFNIDTYIEDQIHHFLEPFKWYYKVELYSVTKVRISLSKNVDLLHITKDFNIGVIVLEIEDTNWIIVHEKEDTVFGLTNDDFHKHYAPVDYLDVNSDYHKRYDKPTSTPKPTEEWTLIKVVGNETIEATQITPATFLLKITNKITNTITFITQDGKAPKN
jgi:hypothetical protein